MKTVGVALKRVNIEYIRVEAVDGRNRSASDFEEYDKPGAVKFLGRELTGGEMGCYLSHLQALERFQNSDAQAAIFLEDDITDFGPHFFENLNQILSHLEKSQRPWSVVNLCPANAKRKRKITDIAEHGLYRAYTFPVWTTAVLWSKDGAEAFLAGDRKFVAPVDEAFRRFFTRNGAGFSVYPPLVPVPKGPSEIGAKRASQGHSRLKWLWGKRGLYFWSTWFAMRDSLRRLFNSD